MQRNDIQLGKPDRVYTDTKTNIEALTGLTEGAVAYASDTDLLGTYNGSTWNWVSCGGDTVRTRYTITPSVSSNNLTLAIKYIDGNDCTTTNKVMFRVGSTEYTLSAAVSFTKNAGTNWMNAGSTELAAQPMDFFVYAIGETGASAGLKFGFSRIPYAQFMSDFVNTNTSQMYIAGNWTNFNSTDAVTNIGRFRAQLSATASFNWSIATALVVNFPIFQTGRLDFNPVWTGFSANPTNTVMQYELVNDVVTVWTRAATAGTSNAASMYLVAPFTTPTITNAIWTDVARCTDNNSIQANPCLLQILSNSSSLVYRKSYSSGADDWTTSGNKFVLTSKISFPLR